MLLRSLASWRPTKIGQIPAGASVYFLSNDAKTVMLSGAKSAIILDLERNRQIKWPRPNSYPVVSPYAPNWAFTFVKGAQLEVRDLSTGQLNRTLRWPQTPFSPGLVSISDGNLIGVVDGDTFYEWNATTGQLLHKTKLLGSLLSDKGSYAVSLNGAQLVGCTDKEGAVWDTSSGKRIHSYKIRAWNFPSFFSKDARIVAYIDTPATGVQPSIVFVDTATGKIKWQIKYNPSLYRSTGDELVFTDATGCAILNVKTGITKRHLPGPLKDANILRATPDYIYTLNGSHKILRWRAR